MANGNPNPSPENRFQPGQSGNPGGKTSAQRKAEVEAAEIAARVKLRMLEDLERLAEAEGAALEELRADTLNLIKEALDRAHGKPTQRNEHTGKDGGAIEHEVSARERIAGRIARMSDARTEDDDPS